jgi:hypothetical protein
VLPDRLGACLTARLDHRFGFNIPPVPSHAATGEPAVPQRPLPRLLGPEGSELNYISQ